MKKILLSVIICFMIVSMNAQGYLWAKGIGIFNNVDYGQSVAFDSQGSMYVTGHFYDSLDCNPGVGVSNLFSAWGMDIFINKYAVNGQFLWAKRIGGLGHDETCYIAIDSSDNLFVTGNFGFNADFDPGLGTATLSCIGPTDIFLAKYDTNGNYIWAKRMGGIENEFSQSISIDHLGNIIITGMFQDTADFDPGPLSAKLISYGLEDGFVAKYDNNGNYLWAKGMGGALNDVANDAAADTAGNIYVTGNFFSTSSDFDPGAGVTSLNSAGLNDIFISKFDETGNFIWAKKMGAASYDEANSIAVEPIGNFYITGYFNSTVDFNPGAGVNNIAAWSTDIFLAKYDNNGNYLWAKGAGGSSDDEGNDVQLDVSGNVYCTGYFAFNANFSVTPSVNILSAGSTDIYMAKYTSTGVLSWAKGVGGIGQDYALSIAVISGSAIGITGAFTGTADFDFSAAVANITTTGPASDICFAKYCIAAPAQPSGITGNIVVCPSTTQTYTIASVNDATTYTWQLPAGWTGTSTTSAITVTTGTAGGVINVRANNPCGNSTFQTLNVTVSNPSLTLSDSDNSCFGQCTGTITPTPLAGTSPYTYSPALLSNLCAGSYTVTLTDNIGCTASASTIITAPSSVTVTSSQTNASCNGLCDGTITPSATGGTGPYSFSGSFSGLCAGTYTVTATDANGCIGTASVTITEPSLFVLTNSHTNVSCFGFCNGTVTPIISGGTAPYSYSGPSTGLCPGTFPLTATDANGCLATASVTITEPSQLLLTSSQTNVTCFGLCDGTATIQATGGTLAYSYLWSPSGNTTAIINSLCAGTYTCTVTDANGCVEIITVTITEPPAVVPNSNGSTSVCPAACTTLSALPSGGNGGPYSITWLPSALTDSPVTVCPSTTSSYTCTATDPLGCFESELVTITVYSATPLTYDQAPSIVCINAPAFLLSPGTPLGGTYSGLGVTGSSFDPLAAGTGTHTITYTFVDGNGCTNFTSSMITVDLCTGVQQAANDQELMIYPNPFNSLVTINLPKALGELHVYNGFGKLIYIKMVTKTKTEIDLSELSNGIYFIKVITDTAVFSKKILKE